MRKFNITVNGKTYEVDVEEVGGVVSAPVTAAPVQTAAPAPATTSAASKSAPVAGAAQVMAPMPGTIVSVKVKVGDQVKNGDLIAILEAMKMENEIFSSADGTVSGVSVSEGAAVNTGDVIVSIS